MQASVLPAGLRPEEHLEPELFEAVVVVGPARLEDLVPVLVHVQLVRLVQPRQILDLEFRNLIYIMYDKFPLPLPSDMSTITFCNLAYTTSFAFHCLAVPR